MAEELLRQDGTYPFLFAGGVMSNRVIRDAIIQKYDASFAEPSFSCDNAAGIAVLAAAQKKSASGTASWNLNFQLARRERNGHKHEGALSADDRSAECLCKIAA